MLIDADKRQERLVASRKNVLLREKRQKEEELWNSFLKGDHITGVVKRLTDFGAFVDVGGRGRPAAHIRPCMVAC